MILSNVLDVHNLMRLDNEIQQLGFHTQARENSFIIS